MDKGKRTIEESFERDLISRFDYVETLSPIVGCYTMHLYCKNVGSSNHSYKEFPTEITGETNAECKAIARGLGWIIHQDNYATCPKCNKAK